MEDLGKAKRERFQCPKKTHSIEWAHTMSSSEDTKEQRQLSFCTSKILAIVYSPLKRYLHSGVVLLFQSITQVLCYWRFQRKPWRTICQHVNIPTRNVLSVKERGKVDSNHFMALIIILSGMYLKIIITDTRKKYSSTRKQKTGTYYGVDESDKIWSVWGGWMWRLKCAMRKRGRPQQTVTYLLSFTLRTAVGGKDLGSLYCDCPQSLLLSPQGSSAPLSTPPHSVRPVHIPTHIPVP